MKKFVKIISVLFFLVILSFIGFMLFMQYIDSQNITSDDGVANNYFAKIALSAAKENFYKNFGSEKVTHLEEKSENPKIGKFHIFYPENMKKSPQKLPVVIFVNGTLTPVSDYLSILEHLASYGFVAIGNDDENSGSGETTIATLDYILSENKNSESIFYQKIDEENVWVFGHSQGGAGAINAITKFENSNKFRAIYTASAVTSEKTLKNINVDYDTSQIKIPYFMMAGTLKSDSWIVSPLADLEVNFAKITSKNPVILARRKEIGHKDVLEYGDAYMTAWFLWQLQNDENAKWVFVWEKAEIFYNKNWQDIKTKNL